MSEIGAGYYKGQDRDISVGDIIAIVVSITIGLPIVISLLYLLFVWMRACYYRKEMERDGTMGTGFFWCWKTSSQVSLSVEQLVDAVPAVLPSGKEAEGGGSGQAKSSVPASRSRSSTPTESDGDVELTASRPAPLQIISPQQPQQPQQHSDEAVIEVS